MAKASVTCTCATCGKEFKVSKIKRNRAEAESWEEWASEHLDECPDCYKARMEQEMIESSKEHNLPELTGTPKQIAWAIKIRNSFITEFDKLESAIEKQKQVEYTENLKNVELALDKVKLHNESSYWIDNRDLTLQRLVRNEMEEK